MKLSLIMLVALVATSSACHQSSEPAITITESKWQSPDVPRPLPVVYATDLDAKACTKLDELHCPEARPRRGSCMDTFRQARTNEVEPGAVDRVSACVADASDVLAVRTCGGPSTLTFECPGR